ncbi:hypothetical protein I3760_13G074800 [Carya illinoinensis]|nr:hypothetical protein I3760_13G074800 [Carya illinoinensis]
MASATPVSSSVSEAIESIQSSLSDLCVVSEDPHHQRRRFSFENPRRFSAFANRLQLLLHQLLRSFPSPDSLPAAAVTAIKGVAADLSVAFETVSVYIKRSKIFVLVHCHSLRSSLQESTLAIADWLALLDSALHDLPDLRKKISDLSRDMKQAQFIVTENEERVHCTLEKEGQGRRTTKAVQSAIIMDLARALGIDPDNLSELSEQVNLFQTDLTNSNSLSERRIVVSLQSILSNLLVQPDIITQKLHVDFEEYDAASAAPQMSSPFKNFLCPLTKEVMKEPVVLETSQNYERTAIEYWFERCIEDARDPTCPVTGQVLKSLELKPNIGLAGAIEEWVNRNIEVQVNSAAKWLREEHISVDNHSIEKVLDFLYKISEEYPTNRYRVRNAGIVGLLVKLLRNSSKSVGTQLRSMALMALLSMAKDEESKKRMLEDGVTRLAIHSLIGSSEKEREFAVKLLLEFSRDEACCIKIASEKGALVLLSSMAGNLEHPTLSNLAEEVFKQMERVEDNVQPLAEAGRFEPLISRLCEGSDDVKIEMASIVGRMTLTNSSKEQIARQSANILVKLLYKPEGRAPSLQALYNLSGLDDNAIILVDSAVLPALTDILLIQDTSPDLKELAASTIAKIVSKPGNWELASIDKRGHSMRSESFICSLLGLLSIVSPRCQGSILHILYGVALSPQASESVTSHIKSGDGIKTIISFLEHSEDEHRIYAFRLTRILSERFGEDLTSELRPDKLPLFKDKLLGSQSTEGEQSDAACILANLSLSEEEVKTLLGDSFVRWTVTTLKNQRRTSNPASCMAEGLLGLLIHFTRSHDLQTLSIVREHNLMTIFCEQLGFPSNPRVKQLAALGLKNLSECGMSVAAGDSQPIRLNGFCSSLVCMCGGAANKPSTCPIHNAACEEESQLCLLKSNCIKPLVGLLTYEDTGVQIAAVETLSTLVLDTSNNFKSVVDELSHQGVVDALIKLFIEVRPGELQERAVWMIERILRVESQSQRLAFNQALVRALVEAFKHGGANTKRHSQDALTNLKQISGISGNASSQAGAPR